MIDLRMLSFRPGNCLHEVANDVLSHLIDTVLMPWRVNE